MERAAGSHTVPVMATIFNLNHHATYVHWHFFQMSWPNIIVIVAMLVVFAIAIAIPFPRARKSAEERP